MKEFIKKYGFVVAIIILCIIKQLMVRSLPVFGRDMTGPDQYKLLTDFELLYKGEFLNDSYFDIYTLFKRMLSFPIFLAICHWLGISYLDGYTLLWTMSCLLAVYAMSKYCRNRFLLGVSFTILLFSPFSYEYSVQMIYNLSFTAPLAISAISCLLIAYENRKGKIRVFLGWGGVLSTLCIVGIWLNREDSVWVLPLIIVYCVIIVAEDIKNRALLKRTVAKLVVCLLPLLMIILADLVVCGINYKKYGIFTTNDYTATNFEKAYNSMLKVEQTYSPDKCSITRKMLEEMYAASPALKELKPYMDLFYKDHTYDSATAADPADGEIEDSLMNIALRDAASRAGYYCDATTANEYWGKVCYELEKAFGEGTLNSRNTMFFGTTLHHPWHKGEGYAKKWIVAAGTLLWDDLCHTIAAPELIYNSVNKETSDRYEAMTINYTVDQPYYRLQVYGWMFDNAGENLYITLLDTDGNVYSVNTYDSPDIADGIHSNRDRCRFGVEVSVPRDAVLEGKPENGEDVFDRFHLKIMTEKGNITELPLRNGIEEENISYYLDIRELKEIRDKDEEYAISRIEFAKKIAGMYKVIGPICFAIFIIGYFYKTVNLVKTIKTGKCRYLGEWWFQSAILGCVLVFLTAISYVHAFMWGSLFYTHTAGALLDFAGCTAISFDIGRFISGRD